MEHISCPVCGSSAESGDIGSQGFGHFYQCDTCGKYVLNGTRFGDIRSVSLSPKEKSSLYYFLTHNKSRFKKNKTLPRFFENDLSDESNNEYSLRKVVNLYPTDITKQIHMILLNILLNIKYIGNYMSYDDTESTAANRLYPMFFIDLDYTSEDAHKQFIEKVEILDYQKLILRKLENKTLTLSFEGWKQVQKLQHAEPIKAFIAMWFDISMEKAKSTIIKAIDDCKYIPVIISDKEYNGQIVPEILYEIRNSRFIISDLTGGRGGVYFESGYAAGLSKVVIYTCKKDYFDTFGVHFDLKQENFILWENEDELHERLVKRIKAVVGTNE